MPKYKNKYFKEIKYKNSCTENLLYNMKNDKRKDKWRKERRKCGGYDERATWNLNTFMTEQIYTWLRMYFDRADGFVDLSFHKFKIKDVEMSERDAILLALDNMKFYLQHSEEWGDGMPQKCNDKIAEAYYIIGVIFPALWW